MNRARETYDRLLAAYGPQHWWPAESSFEVIVGALLMPQTSWRNVEAAIGNLKAGGLLEPRALAAAPLRDVRRRVRVAGLYRSKPARLRAFCRHLLKTSGGDLGAFFDRPTAQVREELLEREGVGPETADSILLYAGGHAVFVVDAYTVRIGKRLGLFATDAYGEVQRYFESSLPRDVDLYREFHALLDEHAKRLCRPRPRCGECPLRETCDFARARKA